MEERPDERNVARYARAEEALRAPTAATPPRARRGRSPPASASGRPPRPARSACCPAASAGASSSPASSSPAATCCCLDEPTNHLDIDAKEWLMGFLRTLPRGAARDQPRPRAARRGDHAGAPPRPARRGRRRPPRRVQGHVHAVPSTPAHADEERLAKPAARQAKEIARLQTHRRPLRRQGHQGGDGPQHGEAHRPARGRAGRRARAGDGRCASASPTPPTPGRTVIDAAGLTKSYGGPPVFEDVAFDLGRGERLLVLGLNGAGKTSLLRILAGETDADRGTFDVRPQRRRRLLRPGARQPARRRRRCSTTSATRCRPDVDAHRDRSCAACSACSGSPARRCSRTPARCPAARRPSWRWRC